VAEGQRLNSAVRGGVLIAPPALLDEFAKQGKVTADAAERAPIGRVGLGVAVRPGAPVPDIASADAVRRPLLEADSLVYNRASTGLYFDGLLKQMGIDSQVAAKTTRYADGSSVMHHVLRGQGREIGVGAITEIVLLRAQGLQLVGPLPAPLQNFTAYAAVPMAGSTNAPAANALLAHLRRSDTRAALAAAGIEPRAGLRAPSVR
jgi:molybdate transport system substrate-binding protein